MLAYLLRRMAWMVPTLFGITLVTFALVRLAPGDPAQMRFASDPNAPAADVERAIERFRAENLLDRSLAVQYLHYIGPFHLGREGHPWFGGSGADPWHGLFALDLGREYLRPQVSVAREISRRLAVTVPLSAIAALLAYALAIPLGVLAALRRGGAFDVASGVLLFALDSLPVFWAALLLQLAFGDPGLDWLPTLGLHGADARDLGPLAYARDLAEHAVLPVACLTYGSLAHIARQLRGSVIDRLHDDYVRAARAKGLPERVVVLRHVLPNSLIPLLTLAGHVLPWLVGGSIIVETVFDLPGVGSYAYHGLLHREYDVVTACTLVVAAMTLVGFWISDLACALVDPRIRHG
jgi:peptide/nickel transport system permease protein